MRKVKFRSAADKRKYEENESSWNQILAKYKPKKISADVKLVQEKPVIRETKKIPSLNEWITGPVNVRRGQKYTGDKIIGIGTMHKSNAVPVFDHAQAKDLAAMRR